MTPTTSVRLIVQTERATNDIARRPIPGAPEAVREHHDAIAPVDMLARHNALAHEGAHT